MREGGKDRVLVRHVLSHSSGLPGVLEPLEIADLANYEKMERLLATQPLAQDPNAFHCYHALTIGWLAGALLRRIDGRTLGRFFREEFAEPLGLDVWIGLPEGEEARVGGRCPQGGRPNPGFGQERAQPLGIASHEIQGLNRNNFSDFPGVLNRLFQAAVCLSVNLWSLICKPSCPSLSNGYKQAETTSGKLKPALTGWSESAASLNLPVGAHGWRLSEAHFSRPLGMGGAGWQKPS